MDSKPDLTKLQGERLDVRYVLLETVVLWEENPKLHDLDALAESIRRYGFVDPPKYDAALEALVYGNGRTHVLQQMKGAGEDVPRGILADSEGHWYVPVFFGVDQASQSAAKALALDHNNLTVLGGDFTALQIAGLYDNQGYAQILETLEAEMMPVSVVPDELPDLLAVIGFVPDFGPASEQKQSRLDRKNPVRCPNCQHEFTPRS